LSPSPELKLSIQGDTLIAEQDMEEFALQVRVDKVRRERDDDLIAETVWLRSNANGNVLIHGPSKLNMSSTPAKKALATYLDGVVKSPLWSGIIEQICYATVERHDRGAPFETIGGARPLIDRIYRLEKMLEENQITILFGEGESCKSTIALAIALSVQTGVPLLGLEPLQGNVLYLDWETDGDEHHRRLTALWKGLGNSEDTPEIPYRRMEQPLTQDVTVVRQHIQNSLTRLVIIDSAGGAMGRDPEKNDSAIQLLSAVRKLQTTALVIDHESKDDSQKEPNKRRQPFGGIYKVNLARSIYEIRAVGGDETDAKHTVETALYHTKCNNGRRQPARGYRLEFNETEYKTMIWQSAVGDNAELAAGMGKIERLRNCIRLKPKSTLEIHQDTGLDEGYLRATLSAGRKAGKFAQGSDGKWGICSSYTPL
jgi:hypothetical protein